MAPASLPTGDPQLRVDLAASFLQHPTARNSNWDVQRRFLLAKGFSETEVQAAHQRCLTGGTQSWPLKPLDVEGIHLALPATVGQAAGQTLEGESSGDDTDSDSDGSESSSSSSSSDAPSGSADDDVPIASLTQSQGQAPAPLPPQDRDDNVPLASLPQNKRKEQTVVPPQDKDDNSPLASLPRNKPKEQTVDQDDNVPLASLPQNKPKEQPVVRPQDQDDNVPLASLPQNKPKEQSVVRPQDQDDTVPLASLPQNKRKEQPVVRPQDQDDNVPLASLPQSKPKEQTAVRAQAQKPVAAVPKVEAASQEVTSSTSSSSSSSSSEGEDEVPAQPAPAKAPAKPAAERQAAKTAEPGATGAGSVAAAPSQTGGQPSEAGFSFRSDAELWPPGSREVRPMLPAQRKELRRVTQEVRSCYQECQQDLADLKAKASAYRRACAGKSELAEAVVALEAEMEKLRLQWSQVVKEVTSKWKDRQQPGAEAAGALNAMKGVRPQVVRGKRWYVACLEGDGGTAKRVLGPLRASFQEAADDQKLLQSKRPSCAVEEVVPEVAAEPGGSQSQQEEPEVESEVSPPRCKRLRLRARVVDDDD